MTKTGKNPSIGYIFSIVSMLLATDWQQQTNLEERHGFLNNLISLLLVFLARSDVSSPSKWFPDLFSI